jgi:hypothetical protein
VPAGILPHLGYSIALAVAAAPLLVTGVARWPSLSPAQNVGTAVWAAWAAPLAGAAVLVLIAQQAHLETGEWGLWIGRFIRLDWLYSALLPVMRGPARVGSLLADLLEGDGAFLWMLVILALVLLYVRR